LREAVGLRRFVAAPSATKPQQAGKAKALPQFKQYREADGLFHFKLVDAEGRTLLQSPGYASPKDAGQKIAALRRGGVAALDPELTLAADVGREDVAAAFAALAAADEG
jgi:tryptophanyl-tRNA synthetase